MEPGARRKAVASVSSLLALQGDWLALCEATAGLDGPLVCFNVVL